MVLALAAEFNEIRDIQDLTKLMREGRMKEFFQLANRVLRIKRSHPVANKVQRINEHGEEEVLDDRASAERAIAEYFANIYKRPEHLKVDGVEEAVDEQMLDENSEQMLDTIPPFSTEDVENAAKDSNFNKGLGPDYFDGNLLRDNEDLRAKVVYEIANALNS